ncbi:hypothetical protein CP082626L3_1273A, partial [Chlamydia psittaci 08-2626_L3]
MLHLPGEAG